MALDVEHLQRIGRTESRTENGGTIRLWARHADGGLAMDATATVG